MLRVASALACLLLVLSLFAPAAAAAGVGAVDAAPALQQGEDSLSLTVTDGDAPVAGADVTLSQNGERVLTGETGDDGRLDTGPLAAGSYRVVVREPGYEERAVSVAVDGDTDRSVTLTPRSVALTVDVADARTGDALADATVDVDAAGTVRTGTDGTQTVRVPVNGEVGLVVTKDGYERDSLSVVVDESPRSVTLEIARETDISLSLSSDSVSAGGRVEATVTDAYGDPVAGAPVLLDGEIVAETDGDGAAAVPVESTGEHAVRARAGDALSEQRPVVADGDGGVSTATASAGDGETPEDVNATSTATPGADTVTATPGSVSTGGDSPFADLPLPNVELPDLGDEEGPLGLLPPIQGSARIVLVLAGVGAVGLVFSILREDDL